MPNLTGKKANKADNKLQPLQQDHFDYKFVGYKTGDTISQKNLKNYKIIDQSVAAGTIIPYDTEIVFKCKKTKAAREAEEKAKAAAKAKAEKEAAAAAKEEMVWIPKSGKCYHSKSSCSRMKNPSQVSRSYAESRGYRACSKCY